MLFCTETCSHHLLALPSEIKTRPHQSFQNKTAPIISLLMQRVPQMENLDVQRKKLLEEMEQFEAEEHEHTLRCGGGGGGGEKIGEEIGFGKN